MLFRSDRFAGSVYHVLELCKDYRNGAAWTGICGDPGSLGAGTISLSFSKSFVCALCHFDGYAVSGHDAGRISDYKKIGFTGYVWSVILPGIFSAFIVFIVYVSFQKIPEEVLEAARIDGSGEWQILWKIGIPMAKEGILSALVLSFLEYWNLIEQPMTFFLI